MNSIYWKNDKTPMILVFRFSGKNSQKRQNSSKFFSVIGIINRKPKKYRPNSGSHGILIKTGQGGFCRKYLENGKTPKTAKSNDIVLSLFIYKL